MFYQLLGQNLEPNILTTTYFAQHPIFSTVICRFFYVVVFPDVSISEQFMITLQGGTARNPTMTRPSETEFRICMRLKPVSDRFLKIEHSSLFWNKFLETK